MRIQVVIQTGEIVERMRSSEGAGAVVRFEGRVRGDEQGKKIRALVYEAYQPMAEKQIGQILRELNHQYTCLAVHVQHRIGEIPVGAIAILIETFSLHRAEAFALTAGFMDRLKQDVPIWKMRAIPAEP